MQATYKKTCISIFPDRNIASYALMLRFHFMSEVWHFTFVSKTSKPRYSKSDLDTPPPIISTFLSEPPNENKMCSYLQKKNGQRFSWPVVKPPTHHPPLLLGAVHILYDCISNTPYNIDGNMIWSRNDYVANASNDTER